MVTHGLDVLAPIRVFLFRSEAGQAEVEMRGQFLTEINSLSFNISRGIDTLAMGTPGPATRPPFSVLEVLAAPFYPLSPCFGLLGRFNPTNPLIARQRREVLPRGERLRIRF